VDARPGNLPVQLTSFVGREEEIAEVGALLQQARLLTLTGAGGTGKSRLALQVAAELLAGFKGGAFFADLSSVTDAALVASVVAGALAVPEVPDAPSSGRCRSACGTRSSCWWSTTSSRWRRRPRCWRTSSPRLPG
jgi:hypothetical protein